MLRDIALVVAGGLVGGLCVFGLSRREWSAPAAAPPAISAPARVPADAQSSRTEERLAQVERSLASLQNAPPGKAEDSDVGGEAKAPAEPRPSREQAALDDARAHEERLAAHAREPVDSTWASAEEASFTEDLNALASLRDISPFTVTSVECRSKSCVAAIEWSSIEGVESARHRVVTAPFHGADCTRTILLPEPGKGPPYQASIIFEFAR